MVISNSLRFCASGFLIFFFFKKYFSFTRKNSYNKRVEFDNDLENMLIERGSKIVDVFRSRRERKR